MNLSNPGFSMWLMRLAYLVVGAGLFLAMGQLGNGDIESAVAWTSGLVVGGGGIISFVRHSIFHRSDAARMQWDLGRRNNFQLEAGFANLAWGATSLAALGCDWSTRAQGALIFSYGLYIAMAAALHLFDVFNGSQEHGHRPGTAIITAAFAVALLMIGINAVQA